ncbi:phosphate acyltransferase [Bacillus marinisedimentorum]|uniref:phosphate acyltransferase n=1 Tax=Bacillus marinisedimentorum TaxID=1821260 RepID=UPI0007E133BF|nr:phosphate acyltransferase [Bacillus marinisedimentorum]
MRFHNFNEVIEQAQKLPPVKISVAAAHDEDVLRAVKNAVELGLVDALLVGDPILITRLAEQMDFPPDAYKVYPAHSEEEAAFTAAKLASDGKADILMKGLVNSTPFLKGALDKRLNLKTGRIISHLSIFDIPNTDSLVFMTDGGLNIAPDFNQKKSIIWNAVDFMRIIGISDPRVAILAANELVNEKMPITVEARELANQIAAETDDGLLIEGPLPLDLAISSASLAHKKLESKLGGKADLLVMPNIEAGNISSKAITYYANGTMAGIVLGAAVPLVLNSRSDSPMAKLASIALAVIAAAKTPAQVKSHGFA